MVRGFFCHREHLSGRKKDYYLGSTKNNKEVTPANSVYPVAPEDGIGAPLR